MASRGPLHALAGIFLREGFRTVGDDLRGAGFPVTDEQVNLLHIDWIDGKPVPQTPMVERMVDAFTSYPRIFGTPRARL